MCWIGPVDWCKCDLMCVPVDEREGHDAAGSTLRFEFSTPNCIFHSQLHYIFHSQLFDIFYSHLRYIFYSQLYYIFYSQLYSNTRSTG